MPPPFSFLSLLRGVWKLSIPIIVSGTEGPCQDSVIARISILCVSWELMKCLASSILFLIDRAFQQAQVIFRWFFLVWLFRFVIDGNIISLLNYCCLVVFFYCLYFALWILGVLPTCTSRRCTFSQFSFLLTFEWLMPWSWNFAHLLSIVFSPIPSSRVLISLLVQELFTVLYQTMDQIWHADITSFLTRNSRRQFFSPHTLLAEETKRKTLAKPFFNFSVRTRSILFAYFHGCPETLFISHENANFLFSVFSRVVQGEAKTPKIMGCCRANFAFLHALKIGTFRGKWTLERVIKTSHFVLLALYFLITSKPAFSLIASQRCLARTAKNVWVRAQNSAKNNFLPPRLETNLAWTFLFLCSFLNNYPWTSEKNSFFNKLWV